MNSKQHKQTKITKTIGFRIAIITIRVIVIATVIVIVI